MSSGSNSRRRHLQSGTTSLEFALVAVPFVFLLLAGMDLGRYFITRHSLRTLVVETARLAVINCAGRSACDYATAVPTPTLMWAKVPFLDPAGSGASLSANQTVNAASGVATVTATASYDFTFVLPAWIDMNGAITETIRWDY
jgi:Flp pilus assembly protein TadG